MHVRKPFHLSYICEMKYPIITISQQDKHLTKGPSHWGLPLALLLNRCWQQVAPRELLGKPIALRSHVPLLLRFPQRNLLQVSCQARSRWCRLHIYLLPTNKELCSRSKMHRQRASQPHLVTCEIATLQVRDSLRARLFECWETMNPRPLQLQPKYDRDMVIIHSQEAIMVRLVAIACGRF